MRFVTTMRNCLRSPSYSSRSSASQWICRARTVALRPLRTSAHIGLTAVWVMVLPRNHMRKRLPVVGDLKSTSTLLAALSRFTFATMWW